jgi:hypothetical protein
VKPHVSIVTLGVRDFARAKRFYVEQLGWPVHQEDDNWVCVLLGGGSTAFTLYPWDELAGDARVSPDGEGFRGVTLAYNVRSEKRVDEVLSEAEQAGAKQPEQTAWGGYSGYFADPEGYLWEIATGATKLPFAE